MGYKLANPHENTVNTKFILSLSYKDKIKVSFSSSVPLIRAPFLDSWVYEGCTFRRQVDVDGMQYLLLLCQLTSFSKILESLQSSHIHHAIWLIIYIEVILYDLYTNWDVTSYQPPPTQSQHPPPPPRLKFLPLPGWIKPPTVHVPPLRIQIPLPTKHFAELLPV